MSQPGEHEIAAVVLDWAGTMIDFGSRAPAAVFEEVFRRQGVEVSAAEAREPMGRAKRDHIATVARMPSVSSRWQQKWGAPPVESDIDRMYEQFLPLQKQVLVEHCDLIPGAADVFRWCRERGLGVASSTGYTRELMEEVVPRARAAGYDPDVILCAEDAPAGRPAPWMIFIAAQRLGIYPLWRMVKVDDTVVGIEAGINAGCWTVGIVGTGNLVGLSQAEKAAAGADELAEIEARARLKLSEAGAHYLVDSIAQLPEVIGDINQRLQDGCRP